MILKTIFQALLFLVLLSATSFASGGDIDIMNGLQNGMAAFPIRTEFIANINEFSQKKFVMKTINDDTFRITLLKNENNLALYRAEILGDSFPYYITVDTRTRNIVSFTYDILPSVALSSIRNIDNLNRIYDQLLPQIASMYGIPTKEIYQFYQGQKFKIAHFYEKNKYEYFFGLYKEPNNPNQTSYRFMVHAL